MIRFFKINNGAYYIYCDDNNLYKRLEENYNPINKSYIIDELWEDEIENELNQDYWNNNEAKESFNKAYKLYKKEQNSNFAKQIEEYTFEFSSETEHGLTYEIGGTIWYDPKDKRYKYQFALTTANDVIIEKENTKGFINVGEAIEEINEYTPNENELLRLVQANS